MFFFMDNNFDNGMDVTQNGPFEEIWFLFLTYFNDKERIMRELHEEISVFVVNLEDPVKKELMEYLENKYGPVYLRLMENYAYDS